MIRAVTFVMVFVEIILQKQKHAWHLTEYQNPFSTFCDMD